MKERKKRKERKERRRSREKKERKKREREKEGKKEGRTLSSSHRHPDDLEVGNSFGSILVLLDFEFLLSNTG